MKIVIVAGARPNFMKIAPLLEAINKYRQKGFDISTRLIYTGCKDESGLDKTLFEDLGMAGPDKYLDIESSNQNERAAGIMTAFETELNKDRPDLVFVVDDLTPTMACSIVAKKLGVKVAHIIAGTRSFDISMPKEVNRMITDGLSDYLFTSGVTAHHNLNKGGASLENAYMVGNILMDTLRHNMDRLLRPSIFTAERLAESGYFLLTINRHLLINNGDKLRKLLTGICTAVAPMKVVCPAHDYVRAAIEKNLANECPANLVITSTLRCLEFWFLEKNAKGVITDSGNVAEEATFWGIPCITLNNYTEHMETVTTGTNVLVGENAELAVKFLNDIIIGKWKQASIPDMWDGRTASRIVMTVVNDFYNNKFHN